MEWLAHPPPEGGGGVSICTIDRDSTQPSRIQVQLIAANQKQEEEQQQQNELEHPSNFTRVANLEISQGLPNFTTPTKFHIGCEL